MESKSRFPEEREPPGRPATVSPRNLCTAFEGFDCIGSGELLQVAAAAKEAVDRGRQAVLIFDDDSGESIELDFRGTVEDVLGRLEIALDDLNVLTELDDPRDKGPARTKGPGRPKLGVVAREVTLLPRHWDWLNKQPGGASVVLRRLVDEARKENATKDIVRRSQEVTYRFISAIAGNLEGFEETTRALFAGNKEKFAAMMNTWPSDIQMHAKKLAAPSFI